MYFAGDIHTSKEVSGDWFSEQKEKMPINYDFHCFGQKTEYLQYMINLEPHMDNSMFQKIV
jgi:uncharacterized beta-barrel protein YwiB (DUF1934 family)